MRDGGRGETTFAIVVTLLFVAVCGTGVAHHEMWRDEAQAWLLARDATGFQDLLARTQYERHPLLWHVLLYFVSRFTPRPEAMQALNLAIAAGAVFLVARAAPFPRWARALLCFGYFPLYEYGVLARNYAIGMLFLFAATALFSRRREHPWMFGIMLGLAAHTSAPALIVAAAVAGAAAVEAVLSRDPRRELTPTVQSCALAGIAIVTVLVQMVPPADAAYSRGQDWTTAADRLRLENVVGLFAEALLPLSISQPFWGRLWFDRVSLHVAPAIAVVALLVVLVHLRRCRPALMVFILSNVALFSFFYAKMAGSIRHHGFLFLTLVISLWIARAFTTDGATVERAATTPRGSTAWTGAILAVLIVQLVAGIAAVAADRRLVFAGGLAAARLLEDRGLANLPMVGHADVMMSPVIAYLGIPAMYFPSGERFGSYTIWDRRRAGSITEDDVFRQALEEARRRGSRVAVVLGAASPVATKWRAREVGCVSADIVADESYCVYSVDAP